ncbi:unnamed protein product [Amoebophrya sp. A25]|nr:unnamed protein product [Amoebophrya sp. A25]|eukprot:GSA25T00006640001.1
MPEEEDASATPGGEAAIASPPPKDAGAAPAVELPPEEDSAEESKIGAKGEDDDAGDAAPAPARVATEGDTTPAGAPTAAENADVDTAGKAVAEPGGEGGEQAEAEQDADQDEKGEDGDADEHTVDGGDAAATEPDEEAWRRQKIILKQVPQTAQPASVTDEQQATLDYVAEHNLEALTSWITEPILHSLPDEHHPFVYMICNLLATMSDDDRLRILAELKIDMKATVGAATSKANNIGDMVKESIAGPPKEEEEEAAAAVEGG